MAREFRFAEKPDKRKADTSLSPKMYKSRITKWGFDKKYVRSKGGKQGGIRKAIRPRRSTAIPTPTSTVPAPAPVDTHFFPPSTRSSNVPVLSRNHFPAEENQEEEPATRNLSCGRPQRSAALTQIGIYDSSMSQGLAQTGHLQTHICRQPSPLPEFRIPEQIFGLVHSYVSSYLSNKTWVYDEYGVYHVKKTTAHGVHIAFHAACNKAVLLFDQNSNAQAQEILSKAFGMVAELLRTEGPQIMKRLWSSLAMFIQNRLVDVALMLRKFTCDMASVILTPAHPYARLWRLLSTTEPSQLESIIYRIWQCTTDAFAKATGQFNQMTLEYQTSLIRHIYRVEDPDSGVRRLHSLLQKCERQRGRSNRSYLRILSALGNHLLDHRNFEQAETVGNDISEHARAMPLGSVFYQALAIEMVAKAHYGLGQHFRAEGGFREAMKIIAKEWGETDPWRMDLMIMLGEWLRTWGRIEDADHIDREIVELSME